MGFNRDQRKILERLLNNELQTALRAVDELSRKKKEEFVPNKEQKKLIDRYKVIVKEFNELHKILNKADLCGSYATIPDVRSPKEFTDAITSEMVKLSTALEKAHEETLLSLYSEGTDLAAVMDGFRKEIAKILKKS